MRRHVIPAAEVTACNLLPPPRLSDGVSLFLDLDGTLLELIDRPDAVVADDDLRTILAQLHQRMHGRVAIVSGRSLAQLDAILGPVANLLALSGSHGAECRIDGGTMRPPRPPQLDAALVAMRDFARRHDPVLLEDKSLGVALHYRLSPPAGPAAIRFASRLADELGLFLQQGDMMIELRPQGHDKGSAITRMMASPPLGAAMPVFVGDDVTDEAGFHAVSALGGYGILAGHVRPSAARFHLPGPAEVRGWLREFVE